MEIQRPIPERIPDVLIWCIREALRDELGYAVNCQKSDIMVMDGQNMITVQYYYYEKYNKCFIEYEIGPSIKPNLGNLDNFKTRILRYIDQNFDYDVYIYPDVVFYDQDISQITDTSHKLTPFTIGCWRCIDGSYEYLYDKAAVMI